MSRLFVSMFSLLSIAAIAAPPAPAAAPAAGAPAAAAPAVAAAPAAADPEQVMYAFGALIAQRTPIASANLTEAELQEVLKGMMDAALDKPLAVKPDDVGKQIDEMLGERRKAAAAKQSEKNVAILAGYEKETGAEKTPSGLIFTNVKVGEGAQPNAADTVKVHYKGTLTDGTEFDSSYSRNEPTEFPLNGVIPCWTQGVAKMKVGGKAKLVCPPDIAYGERGAPPKIGPNSVLVFEVELLEVKPAAAPAAAPGAPAAAATATATPAAEPAKKCSSTPSGIMVLGLLVLALRRRA